MDAPVPAPETDEFFNTVMEISPALQGLPKRLPGRTGRPKVFTPVVKFSPMKHGMRLDARKIIRNLYCTIKQAFPHKNNEEIVQLTSKSIGVSRTTIFKIINTETETDVVEKKLPTKEKYRDVTGKYDRFTIDVIRKLVHGFFQRNEPPTLDKILVQVNSNLNISNFNRSALWLLLKQIGFKYESQKRNSALIEREDIIAWRCRYLRGIRKARQEGKKIYYTDETWLNAGDVVDKTWQDKTVLSARQAFMDNLSTGLKAPSGKGGRLIITHIGSEDGFVDNGLLCFRANKSDGDYHGEMNGEVYCEWLEKIFPLLDPGSVIVMDNAPYHSQLIEKAPTTSWKKADITAWLTNHNINFSTKALKKDLLAEAYKVKDQFKQYKIDERATELGFTIIRLPPYHCELNPIENVWSQVKRYVRKKNTTFKLVDVERLLPEAILNVTAEQWKNYVHHIIGIENNFWKLDNIQEEVEPLLFTVNNSDDSDDHYFSDKEN